MRRDVVLYFKRCAFCMAYSQVRYRNHWLNLPVGTPFEVVAMDLYGPLPITASGNRFILVMIDHHTRWVELVPMQVATAKNTAYSIFHHWISRWGTMRSLLTDNGGQFNADLIRYLCRILNITKLYSAPYHPRGNSVVEAYMRTLKTALRLCVKGYNQEWDVALSAVTMAYRATPHTVTGYSPYFLVTGTEMVLPISREWEEPTFQRYGSMWLGALWKARLQIIEAHAQVARDRRAKYFEKGRKFEPGMLVAVRLNTLAKGVKSKFAPLYKGPAIVEHVWSLHKTARVRYLTNGRVEDVSVSRVKFLDVLPDVHIRKDQLPRVRLD